MTLPIKTFWPSLAQSIFTVCKYITRHQATLNTVVATVDPTDAVAVAAALASLVSACELFIRVMSHVDPNWKPQ